MRWHVWQLTPSRSASTMADPSVGSEECVICHGIVQLEIEVAPNWQGSMMAQAARDPLFYACLAVANQDAANAGDTCIRCHSPKC